MYRNRTCGELRMQNIDEEVELSGWIQKNRDLGGMTFIDLRDRYGITQIVFNMETDKDLCLRARELGREFVIRIKGKVAERSSKNKNLPTGDIEIVVREVQTLSECATPPFLIEDETDGGEELRMKYRFLDLRRNPLKNNLMLRHRLAMETRNFLDKEGFLEIETPFLIKSTPEGARDFIVPSSMNRGQFYALPQSPQIFKQLLMISGYDRYFQIVRCFRDEALRADRQPEFTQIDCEMAFVHKEDVIQIFEKMMKHLFKTIKGLELNDFPKMSYDEAMQRFGSDKPDLRFGMEFVELNDVAQGKGFNVFDGAELVVGICAKRCADYSRKQLDELTGFVKKPQIGAKGLVYVKYNEDGSFKSSVDKFFNKEDFEKWAGKFEAKPGDLFLILAGTKTKTRKALNELRLEMGKRLNLRATNNYKPLWVTDFPLLEWDEETQRFYAMHHPFTSPVAEDIAKLGSDPGAVRANAYDLVINGVEIGGGSIRIHDKGLQKRMFEILGFTDEEAKEQFGFLLNAFQYGAPPHGGIALGFDRLCAVFGGSEVIRDYIAFPKNNAGRDLMIDAPAKVSQEQLKELGIDVKEEE